MKINRNDVIGAINQAVTNHVKAFNKEILNTANCKFAILITLDVLRELFGDKEYMVEAEDKKYIDTIMESVRKKMANVPKKVSVGFTLYGMILANESLQILHGRGC